MYIMDLYIKDINNMKKYVLFVLVGSLILTGCQTGFTDMSRKLPIREVYHLPSGGISDLAWLDSQTIIMDIDEGNYPKFEVLDINSRVSKPIHITSTCKRPYTRSLKILPNQRAGFILDCSGPIMSQTIQEIDITKDVTSDFYVEPYIRWVGNFSYSHDMKETVLVDVNGIDLESSLYHLDENGNRTNITTEFQRADFPAWSPTADVVAFLGTKPRLEGNDPKNWSQIENLFDYPWRLYLYNSKEQKTDELPIEIVHPGRYKWSPDGNLLAFTGEYKSAPGVWIVANLDNPDKLTVTKVVDSFAVFDFFPDSKSLVFTYDKFQNTEKHNIIYIIDLPAQNTNP
jgi:hypothetical protein